MKKLVTLIFVIIIYFVLFNAIKNNSLYDDEPSHYTQIRLFLKGHPVIYSRLSLIPGYHLTVATLATILGEKKISQLRSITLTINLLAIAVFFHVTQKLDSKSALTKTLQFSFFPILFPFQFLLYPEGLLLLLTLISFFFTLKKQFNPAALFGILSFLVRQTNIVWFLLIHIFCIIRMRKNNLWKKRLIEDNWMFITGYILFAAFVIINKGFVIGTEDVHPNFLIFSSGIFFALFITFCLFLPLMVYNLPKVIDVFRKNKLLILAVVIFLIMGTLTFTNSHPWNRYPESLQNKLILIPFSASMQSKLIFFLIISFSILSLGVTNLYKRQHYLLYPFTLIMLMPIWLISSRYLLVPFTFFLLFRKITSPFVEWLIIIIFMAISIYLFNGYLLQTFYL